LAIKEKKIQTTVEMLCKGLPEEFVEYMNIVRALKFEETPNYNHLKTLFTRLLKANSL
jgi:casein kinase 1